MDNLNDDDCSDIHKDLIKFLVKEKRNDLETILKHMNIDIYHALYIHSQELLDVSTVLFSETMSNPDIWMPKLDSDLEEALKIVLDETRSDHIKRSSLIKKEKVHLRISNLPAIPWFQKKLVPRCYEDGDVIQLVGIVTKTVQPKLLTWRNDVKCLKCGYTFPIEAAYDQFYLLPNSG